MYGVASLHPTSQLRHLGCRAGRAASRAVPERSSGTAPWQGALLRSNPAARRKKNRDRPQPLGQSGWISSLRPSSHSSDPITAILDIPRRRPPVITGGLGRTHPPVITGEPAHRRLLPPLAKLARPPSAPLTPPPLLNHGHRHPLSAAVLQRKLLPAAEQAEAAIPTGRSPPPLTSQRRRRRRERTPNWRSRSIEPLPRAVCRLAT